MNKRLLGLALAAVMGLSVSVSVTPAKADLINGQFSIFGTDTSNLSAQTVIFNAGTIIPGNTQLGSFSALGGANVGVTLFGEGATINYTTYPIGTVFLTGPNSLSFTTTALVQVDQSAPNSATLNFAGTFTFDSFDPTPGTLTLTLQGNGPSTFSATAVAVPGPIVGAGLPGLVVACGGLLALVRRRRRKFA